MRLPLLAIAVFALAGCSGHLSGQAANRHFTSKVIPQAESMILRFFRPAGPLNWGPIQRQANFHEGHFLGGPTSTRTGDRLFADATVGKLIYRVSADYDGGAPLRIEISVRDGREYPYDMPPMDVARRFQVEPGLVEAFRKIEGFAKYGGESFAIGPDAYGASQQTRLSCVFEFRD